MRELDLDGVPDGQRNWLNDHTVYTHGYGVVAAYGNQRTADGKPVFFEQNIPSTGKLGKYEPRIYFGEQSPDYSIVGAPAGGAARVRLPRRSARRARPTPPTPGNGGVPIGTLLRQARLRDQVPRDQLPALRRGQLRLPAPRPPHPARPGRAGRAVADPRRQRLPGGRRRPGAVDRRRLHDDGDYPNSAGTIELDQATSDSVTDDATSVQAVGAGQVNYIRNSVKATVDAYDGTVHLYAWDDDRPDAQGVDGGLPRHGPAAVATSAPT